MRDARAEQADRLRIAAVLLNQGEPAALMVIRKMRSAERAHLTGLINWAREYEANDEPECATERGNPCPSD